MRVFENLKTNGLHPWIDKKSLRPGDNWDQKIRSAIRTSRFFLVLLTKRSVNKKGYLQKEIKEALDIQDEQPDSGRYVIPVRLEECDIPERIAQIQSADLFDQDGWAKLSEILSEPVEEAATPPITSGMNRRPQQLSVGGV